MARRTSGAEPRGPRSQGAPVSSIRVRPPRATQPAHCTPRAGSTGSSGLRSRRGHGSGETEGEREKGDSGPTGFSTNLPAEPTSRADRDVPSFLPEPTPRVGRHRISLGRGRRTAVLAGGASLGPRPVRSVVSPAARARHRLRVRCLRHPRARTLRDRCPVPPRTARTPSPHAMTSSAPRPSRSSGVRGGEGFDPAPRGQ